LKCGLEFFAPDKVVFASDAPFGPAEGRYFIEQNLAALEALDLSEERFRKIAFENATKLLGIQEGEVCGD
jgi:aminocarboxymuconate-semialdehyde decarboxylase